MSNVPIDKEKWAEDYLDNQLDAAQRQAFEEALAEDEALRAIYELKQEIREYFGSEVPALRKQLAHISASHFAPRRRSRRRWTWALAVLGGALLLGGLYWWRRPAHAPSGELPQQDTTIVRPADTLPRRKAPVLPLDEATPSPAPRQEAPQEPIAALDESKFVPSAVIESLMDEQVRAAGVDSALVITVPPNDFTYSKDERPVSFALKGDTKYETVYYEIYNNDDQRFLDEAPLRSELITLDEAGGEGRFAIDYATEVALTPGLYYLLVKESAAALDVLHLSRFKVQ